MSPMVPEARIYGASGLFGRCEEHQGKREEVTARGSQGQHPLQLVTHLSRAARARNFCKHAALLLLVVPIPYIRFSFFCLRVEETGSMRVSDLLKFTRIINGWVSGLGDMWLMTTQVSRAPRNCIQPFTHSGNLSGVPAVFQTLC